MTLILQRALYQLLLWLTLPWIPLRLLLRGVRERGYWRHVSERFGWMGTLPGHPVWIHAVSVGEARAAAPLVAKFLAQSPAPPLLITCMTPAGRATLEQLFGEHVTVRYLPYDFAGAMAFFLRQAQPRLGIIMETELWPNLVRASQRAGVKLFLVNARLSARSARGYRKLAALARATLSGFEAVAAQTQADARRLLDLGARSVSVSGNLKFDVDPPATAQELGRMFRQRIGPRPVWLAASTREGEERLVLEAFAHTAPAEALLVLVPRHPQRFDGVAVLARSSGLSLQRRSGGEAVRASTRVWLGDSLGEMFAYYQAADCALIGGSLLPYGGQNLIEACAVGCPVILGPHTENFKQAAEDAIAQGAAVRVANAESWIGEAARLMRDEVARQRMGEAGKAFTAAHKGAAGRVWALLGGATPP
ncbi:lipid IV(A) 3-deoxy-D-manno-octulosonic acid transferase [Thiobacillus sp. 63-78]|uniref:lipid IV(A) 3-deoxy-D-manno-octulosonic acid transferase n=1 Tax=Thiobacillus sp. 63-78 TaxID=1895859 RepID=UPI000A7039B9|nr:lipid IV(A) 3-deoxy-D-manno-octulosonic acid transferase [Thiobacillus sp. 63-78]